MHAAVSDGSGGAPPRHPRALTAQLGQLAWARPKRVTVAQAQDAGVELRAAGAPALTAAQREAVRAAAKAGVEDGQVAGRYAGATDAMRWVQEHLLFFASLRAVRGVLEGTPLLQQLVTGGSAPDVPGGWAGAGAGLDAALLLAAEDSGSASAENGSEDVDSTGWLEYSSEEEG